MGKQVIKVGGMTCGHCKNAVEKAVKALEGVRTAEVSLENHTLTVELDESAVTLATIKGAIEEEGYTVG